MVMESPLFRTENQILLIFRKFVEYLRVKDSVERQIYSALIWGILLKSMKEDPKRQRNTRRLVMEASKALDDDCVFEILKDAVEKHAEVGDFLIMLFISPTHDMNAQRKVFFIFIYNAIYFTSSRN